MSSLAAIIKLITWGTWLANHVPDSNHGNYEQHSFFRKSLIWWKNDLQYTKSHTFNSRVCCQLYFINKHINTSKKNKNRYLRIMFKSNSISIVCLSWPTCHEFCIHHNRMIRHTEVILILTDISLIPQVKRHTLKSLHLCNQMIKIELLTLW